MSAELVIQSHFFSEPINTHDQRYLSQIAAGLPDGVMLKAARDEYGDFAIVLEAHVSHEGVLPGNRTAQAASVAAGYRLRLEAMLTELQSRVRQAGR